MHAGCVGRVFRNGRLKSCWRRGDIVRTSVFAAVAPRLAAFAVETLLLASARFRLVILPGPLIGTLAALLLPAAERTTEILPTCVTRMRQEAYPTVATANRAVLQIRTIAQDGIQRVLVLTNKRIGAVVLVPILAKRENFRDRYEKIARFSVTMLIGFCIASSYSLDAKASRGRARFFYGSARKKAPLIRANDSYPNSYPLLSSCPVVASSPRVSTGYSKRKNTTPAGAEERPHFFLSK